MSTRAYIAAQLLNAGFFAISGSLTIICLCNLAGHKAVDQDRSRQRLTLLAYVAIIGGLSLMSVVYDSVRFVAFVQYLTDVCHGHSNIPIRFFEDDMLRVVLPFAVWGAEGFMIWRLYEHIRPTEKRGAFLVGCLTTILIALSIASSIPLFSYRPRTHWHQYGKFIFAYRFFSFFTALVNVSISVAIAARLVFWDKVFDGIEREWKAYGRVIARILVASGALLTLCTVLSASFYKVWVHDWMVIPIFVMPQISAISPLLIVYDILKRPHVEEGSVRLEDTPVPESENPANA